MCILIEKIISRGFYSKKSFLLHFFWKNNSQCILIVKIISNLFIMVKKNNSQCIFMVKIISHTFYWKNNSQSFSIVKIISNAFLSKNNSQCNFGLVWVDLVLWNISDRHLFCAKSSLFIYIKYMICKHILLIMFLNESNSTQINGSKYCYISLTIQFDNKGVFHILQSSLSGASPSACLVPLSWIIVCGGLNHQKNVLLGVENIISRCILKPLPT